MTGKVRPGRGLLHGTLVASLLISFACRDTASEQPELPPNPTPVRRGLVQSLLVQLGQAEIESGVSAIRGRVVSVGGEERLAIFAHAPSRISFAALPVAQDAVLEFGVGIEDGGKTEGSDGVEFRVEMSTESRGGSTVLWSHEVEPNDGAWHDASVPLPVPSSSRFTVSLITNPQGQADWDWSAWSNPVIRSSGTSVRLDELPILRHVEVTSILNERRVTSSSETVKVPPLALLELSGKLGDATVGEVQTRGIALMVNDDVLYDKSLGILEPGTFDRRVSLAGYAGRQIEVTVEARGRRGAPTPVFERLRVDLIERETIGRREAPSGPNLLFLMVDTLRVDHLGLYGYGRNTSPELDRFAREGRVFQRALSQCSWTLPAVGSIMTGLYPTQHGVTNAQPLDSRFETFAERLQSAGLTTLAVSANPIVGRTEGLHQGFETFLHYSWARAGHVNEVFLDWARENADLRWFAYLHYIDPHDPYAAPEPWRGVFTGQRSSSFAEEEAFQALWKHLNFGKDEVNFDRSDVDYLIDAYDEEIRYWDDEFGKLLEQLDALGQLDRTIVVVVSDHGEEFLEHGRLKHGQQLYEESVAVPLIVWAPGLIEAGTTDRPVETRWLRTALLDWMGLGAADDAGRVADPPAERQALFAHSNHGRERHDPDWQELAAVWTGDWKFIANIDTGRGELYDLSEDPLEKRDLSQERTDLTRRYRNLIEEWLSRSSKQFQDGPAADPETQERLRALGYLE